MRRTSVGIRKNDLEVTHIFFLFFFPPLLSHFLYWVFKKKKNSCNVSFYAYYIHTLYIQSQLQTTQLLFLG